MRCRKVVEQLSAFLDSELSPRQAEQIQAHLNSCPACRREREGLARAIAAVKDLPTLSAPADLHDRVMADIEAAPAKTTPVSRNRAPAWRVLWPAAAAILLAVGIMLLTRSPTSPLILQDRVAETPSRTSETTVAFLDETKDADRKQAPDYGYEGMDDIRAGAALESENALRAKGDLIGAAPKPLSASKAEKSAWDKPVETEVTLDMADAEGVRETQLLRKNRSVPSEAEQPSVFYGFAPRPFGLHRTEVLIPSENTAADFATVSRLVKARKLTVVPRVSGDPLAETEAKDEIVSQVRVLNLLLTPAQFDNLKINLKQAGLMNRAVVAGNGSGDHLNGHAEMANEVSDRFMALRERAMRESGMEKPAVERLTVSGRTVSASGGNRADEHRARAFRPAATSIQGENAGSTRDAAARKSSAATASPVPPMSVAIILFPAPEALPPPAAALEAETTK